MFQLELEYEFGWLDVSEPRSKIIKKATFQGLNWIYIKADIVLKYFLSIF